MATRWVIFAASHSQKTASALRGRNLVYEYFVDILKALGRKKCLWGQGSRHVGCIVSWRIWVMCKKRLWSQRVGSCSPSQQCRPSHDLSAKAPLRSGGRDLVSLSIPCSSVLAGRNASGGSGSEQEGEIQGSPQGLLVRKNTSGNRGSGYGDEPFLELEGVCTSGIAPLGTGGRDVSPVSYLLYAG